MKSKLYLPVTLLVACALCACNKNEIPGQESQNDEYSYLFKVAPSEETKAVFGENCIVWEDGDLISGFAKTSKNKSSEVSVNGDGEVTVKVRSSVALASGDKVYTYFPYSEANGTADATAVTLEIPASQVSGDADAMPMVSLPFTIAGNVNPDTETEVGTLQFLNLGSLLKFNIFSTNASYRGETIESVIFDAGAPIAGEFTYNLTTADASNPATISGYVEETVTVTGTAAIGATSDDAAQFIMVVAPGSYAGKFIVRTNLADYTYTSASEREYGRASLKPFDIDLAGSNWTRTGNYDQSIDSAREFASFLAGTSSSDTGTYTITADLDMTGYTLNGASGFAGTLDGQGHKISNITSSAPLFLTYKGTVKDIVLDETCIFNAGSLIFGAIAAQDESTAKYSGITSSATVVYTPTADNINDNYAIGGLVGYPHGSTFTSCVTTEDASVTMNAAGFQIGAGGIGGIAGYGAGNVYLDACKNNGSVTLNAKCAVPHQEPDSNDSISLNDAFVCVGGVIGRNGCSDVEGVIKNCENYGKVTLNETAIEGIPGPVKNNYLRCTAVGGIMGSALNYDSNGNYADRTKDNTKGCKNYGEIDVDFRTSTGSTIGGYCTLLHVGGISGQYGSFSNCVNEGNIDVKSDASGTESNGNHFSGVGGICGAGTRNKDSHAYYCNVKANITVGGKCAAQVGGIFGQRGKQIGNKVKEGTAITAVFIDNGSNMSNQGSLGGLVGYLKEAYSIKGCTCVATLNCYVQGTKYTTHAGPSVGGLIGKVANFQAYDDKTILFSYNNTPCSFTGTVSSSEPGSSEWRIGQNIGTVIGYVKNESKTQKYGESGYNIKVDADVILGGDTNPDDCNLKWSYCSSEYETGNVTCRCEFVTDPEPAALMTFNIREGNEWSSRKAPIVSMIKDQHPAIIGLQEVKDLDFYDHLTEDHPWDYLRSNLSDAGYLGVRDGSNTTAFLYDSDRMTLSDNGQFYLRDNYNERGDSWDGYVRVAQYAAIHDNLANKDYFYLNTHFPLNHFTEAMNVIEGRIAALNTNSYPVILMGDFNCVYGNAAFDNIKSSMANTRYAALDNAGTANRDLYTFNNFGEPKLDGNGNDTRQKVDHIWVSNNVEVAYYVTLTQEIKKYGSVDFLSDHYPVLSTII